MSCDFAVVLRHPVHNAPVSGVQSGSVGLAMCNDVRNPAFSFGGELIGPLLFIVSNVDIQAHQLCIMAVEHSCHQRLQAA